MHAVSARAMSCVDVSIGNVGDISYLCDTAVSCYLSADSYGIHPNTLRPDRSVLRCGKCVPNVYPH